MLPPKLKRKKRREAPVRCPAHLSFVRKHSCCVKECDRLPIEAAHVRIGGDGGTSLKPGDDRTISLCASHHAQQHTLGERSFAQMHGLDLAELARLFWQQSPARIRWEKAA